VRELAAGYSEQRSGAERGQTDLEAVRSAGMLDEGRPVVQAARERVEAAADAVLLDAPALGQVEHDDDVRRGELSCATGPGAREENAA